MEMGASLVTLTVAAVGVTLHLRGALAGAASHAARAALGALGAGLAAAGALQLIDGLGLWVGALCAASCVFAAAVAPSARAGLLARPAAAQLSALGWACGPALAAAALAAFNTRPAPPAWLLHTPAVAELAAVAAVVTACAAALGVRALTLHDSAAPRAGRWPAPSLLAASLLGACAFRALALLGGSTTVAHVPLTDAHGVAVRWLADVDLGAPVAVPAPDSGGLILAGAAMALVAAFLPRGRTSAAAAALAGLGLLAGPASLLARIGTPADLPVDLGKRLLQRLDAPAQLIQSPLYRGDAPFALGLDGMEGPLALTLTAGVVALGVAASHALHAPDPTPDADADADASPPWRATAAALLAARDALQTAALCAWMALAAVLVMGHELTGVWGPASARDHAFTAAALALTSAVFALHAAGARDRPELRALRAVALAASVAVCLGVLAGGVVSSWSAFALM